MINIFQKTVRITWYSSPITALHEKEINEINSGLRWTRTSKKRPVFITSFERSSWEVSTDVLFLIFFKKLTEK